MSIWAEADPSESEIGCHVVVVGGGPAGSAAAHAAAQSGLKVLLVERGSAGRDKACGDMFVPSAIEIMRNLGVDCRALLAAGSGASFDAVELRSARGLMWRVRYPAEPVWIIPRTVADQALRDSLPPGVRVLYQASVGDIVELPRSLLGATASLPGRRTVNLSCEAVILATGAQDPLPVRWGISGERILAPSISAYVRNPGLDLPAFEFLATCRPGYRWSFPAGDGCANLGVCALAPTKGSPLKDRGRNLLLACRLAPEVRWRGGAGALWSGRGVSWHHSAGVISCGDAAGLIDPINGEGLTAALASGQAAGNAIADFLMGNQNMKSLRNYSDWIRTTFTAKYALSPVRVAWKQLCGIHPDRV
jgi:flavin-dependent dehydrogenase